MNIKCSPAVPDNKQRSFPMGGLRPAGGSVTTTQSTGLLSDLFAQPSGSPELYVRGVNGHGDRLMDRRAALALFEQTSADPRLDVAGHPDAVDGFTWPTRGAIPARVHTVRPLALPARPTWPAVLSVTIILVFPTAGHTHHERHFHADVVAPMDAYNVACCLWSTSATGRGAERAALVDDADGRTYEVREPAQTCGWFPAEVIARIAATGTDVFTEPPQSGAPGKEAVHPPAQPCRERRTTRAGRELVDRQDDEHGLEGAPSAPPATKASISKDQSMDPQAEQPPTRAGHIALSLALTKQYRKAGPMEHATGTDCSPVPLHRLRDLTHSLRDLPEDRLLIPLPSFDGFPVTTGNSADRAKLTGELTQANLAGRDAAAAERA